MTHALSRLQYAIQAYGRVAAIGGAGMAVTGIVAVTIIWAPPEQAALVIGFVGQILAAVAAAVSIEWWKRHPASTPASGDSVNRLGA